jgi:ubiquinone/menaquinone biosynthesis C-methylase UbiE
MNDKNYFEYLKNRSWFSFTFRKYFYKNILKELKGKTLDIGCGLGEFIKKNGSGIDMNPYCVNYCKGKGLDVKKGKAEKIPFKNNTFDSVFCLCVLEHLKKPKQAIKEMARVLKPKGKLILIVPTECGFRHDKTHVKFWHKDNTRELLKPYFRIRKMFFYPFSSRFMRELLYFNELRIIATKK